MNNNSYYLGGSLPRNAPSYVTRQADHDIYQALKKGQYCYVLNSRQMGKSSLGIHTLQKLREDGVACAIISLSNFGTDTTTSEQWYGGIIRSLCNFFIPSFDWRKWLEEQSLLSPVMRLSEFIENILLEYVTEKIVIFFDEIDSILTLKFNNDDFFLLIRNFSEQRSINSKFQRLCFVFLGVASPSDLIQDPIKTPFNIGQRINLEGFKFTEVKPLIEGLVDKVDNPELVMKEILAWTGGQPFLTQKICELVCEQYEQITSGNERNKIQQLVYSKIINNWVEQDHPQHLRTIEHRILADVSNTINFLECYRKILEKENILVKNIDSELFLKLKISGLIVDQQEELKVYNEIYKTVFNSTWIDNHLEKLRPYALLMKQWFTSGQKEQFKLLQGNDLEEALRWSKDNKNLSRQDYKYLDASKELQQKVERTKERKAATKKIFALSILGTLASLSLGLGWLVNAKFNYDNYASCSIGRRIKGICFREVITSGEEERLFISNNNFHLIRGTQYFKEGNYPEAIQLFEQAISADPSDPVPLIYLNNAKARLKDNPLKLAVSVPIDHYEDAAKEMLRGVADAQDEFNKQGGKDGRLLEIVIANDGNEASIASDIAENLVKRQNNILGVIGYHTSEITKKALPTYKENGLAIISPTSSSSELKDDVFFRTVDSTKNAAQIYATYVKKVLHLDKIAVFSDVDSLYSQTFEQEFKEEFKKLDGNTTLINIKKFQEIINNRLDSKDELNISREINNLIYKKKYKSAILITNVQINSVALAIARINDQFPENKKLKLLGSMALSEEVTITKGGKSVEGMILESPCIDNNSDYMKRASERWQKKIYWRTATSYDAAKTLIESIRKSDTPITRKTILNNLQFLTLSSTQVSGYAINWSDKNHSNPNRKYCLYQIKQGKFKQLN